MEPVSYTHLDVYKRQGLYPVRTRNVLIEDSVAIGASDAGIYVGQSRDVVVRNNRAEYNVDVYKRQDQVQAL